MSTTSLLSTPVPDHATRPLEADLYSADQQGLDQENISATGNLNIGVVIDYDARHHQQLGGGMENDEYYSSDSMQLNKEPLYVQPSANSMDSPSSNYHSDHSNALQNAAMSGAPNMQPMTQQQNDADKNVAVESRSAPAALQLPTGGETATTPVSSSNVNGGSNSVTNNNVTYVTNEPKEPNTTYNIENNYYAGDTITINNITTNNYTNNYDIDIVNEVVDTAGDILTVVINNATTIVNNLGDTLEDIIFNLVNNVFDEATTIINTLPDLLTTIVNTVGGITNHVIDAVTDILVPTLDTLGDIVVNITAPVNNLLETVVDILNDVLQPGQGSILEPVIEIVDTVLSPVIDNVVDDTVQLVTDVVNPVVDLVGDVPGLLEQIIHDAVGTVGDVADVAQDTLTDVVDVISNLPVENTVAQVTTIVTDALQGDLDVADILETVQDATSNILLPVTNLVTDTLENTVDTLLGGHANDLLQTLVDIVHPVLTPVTDTVGGLLGGAFGGNGNDLADLNLNGLVPLGTTGTTDNDLVDLNALGLTPSGNIVQDNDLVDLDLLGSGQHSTAVQDNDLIDADLGLLGLGGAASAPQDNDFIDLDANLLSGNTENGNNGIADITLTIDATNAPIIGQLAENLQIPEIEISTTTLLSGNDDITHTISSTLENIVGNPTDTSPTDLVTALLELNSLDNNSSSSGGGGILPVDTGTLLGGVNDLLGGHDDHSGTSSSGTVAPIVNILPVLPPPVVVAPPSTGGLFHGLGFHH